jgi:hypothetical protein
MFEVGGIKWPSNIRLGLLSFSFCLFLLFFGLGATCKRGASLPLFFVV